MKKVTITQERLAQLIDSEAKLTALENGGVDNWDFYDDAMEEYNSYKTKKEILNLYKDKINNTLESIFDLICDNGVEYPCGVPEAGIGIKEEVQDNCCNILKDFVLDLIGDYEEYQEKFN